MGKALSYSQNGTHSRQARGVEIVLRGSAAVAATRSLRARALSLDGDAGARLVLVAPDAAAARRNASAAEAAALTAALDFALAARGSSVGDVDLSRARGGYRAAIGGPSSIANVTIQGGALGGSGSDCALLVPGGALDLQAPHVRIGFGSRWV